MKRIVMQIGHKNIKSNCYALLRGSTGAGGEVEINTAVVNEAVKHLLGVEVKVVDANYSCDPTSLDEDWDLFIAVHCDMDYANDKGSGFCDFPEPSTDGATKESQRCAKSIQDYFFPKVGINVKSRSNANTKFYYMWKSISEKTPCVLIEMGQVKDPHDSVILKDTAKTGKALAEAILVTLGLPVDTGDDCAVIQAELDSMRDSRNKWKTKCEEQDREHTADLQAKIKHIEELQKTVAELGAQITLNTGANEANLKEIVLLRGVVEVVKQEQGVIRELLDASLKENERLSKLLTKCRDGQAVITDSFIERLVKFLKGGL